VFNLSKLSIEEIDAFLQEELEKEAPSPFPPTFKWDREGKTLIGEVVNVRHVNTRAVSDVPVAEIKDRKGNLWSLWISPLDLNRKWLEANISLGDHVAIRYLRLSGQTKIFRLVVVRKDGEKVSMNYLIDLSLPTPEV